MLRLQVHCTKWRNGTSAFVYGSGGRIDPVNHNVFLVRQGSAAVHLYHFSLKYNNRLVIK